MRYLNRRTVVRDWLVRSTASRRSSRLTPSRWPGRAEHVHDCTPQCCMRIVLGHASCVCCFAAGDAERWRKAHMRLERTSPTEEALELREAADQRASERERAAGVSAAAGSAAAAGALGGVAATGAIAGPPAGPASALAGVV